MGYMDEYKFWLESDCFDEKTKEELRSIADDDKEIFLDAMGSALTISTSFLFSVIYGSCAFLCISSPTAV